MLLKFSSYKEVIYLSRVKLFGRKSFYTNVSQEVRLKNTKLKLNNSIFVSLLNLKKIKNDSVKFSNSLFSIVISFSSGLTFLYKFLECVVKRR